MENIIDLLQERGLIEATTHEQMQDALQKPIKVYCGFDPTADSLHLGNMVGIMVLAWFQRCGHVPVAVVGGATGLVGDPSGKSQERPQLSEEKIAENLEGIRKNLEGILDFSTSENRAMIVNNYDWFSQFSYIGFLRDVGKHFRMGPMLSKESVKTRLQSDEGMSFTEFCYQTLQGYDFYYLYKEHNVQVQIGGSDQWGNITAGTDLIRKLSGKSAFGLTFPLLTKSDGKKFGKSEQGAIWLSREKVSPYAFYQHLYRTADSDVIQLLKALTFLPMSEIHRIAQQMESADYSPNTAQKILAEEVTKIVHGQEGLEKALSATKSMKPGGQTLLSAEDLEAASGEIPVVEIEKTPLLALTLVELFVHSGLVKSKGEARRLLQGGGAYLNNAKITDMARKMTVADFVEGRLVVLGAGKKKRVLVRVL